MHRLRLPAAALAALTLAAVAAPPAAHAADERAAALQFGYAAYRARLAIKATAPEIRRRVREIGAPSCARAVFHAPRRALDQAIEVFAVGMVHALFDPTLPALRTLSAQLDAVPTADPALRSGRTAWRKTVGAIAALPPLDDPCGKLIAWRRSGYAPSAAPALDRAKLKALNDSGGPDPRFARAARRMRALGVSKSAADRFTGGPLFRGLISLDDILGPHSARAHGPALTL